MRFPLLVIVVLGCGGGGGEIATRRRPVAGPTPRALVLTDAHGCLLLDDRTVACWGSNAQGALGDGTLIDRERPVAVAGLRDVLALDAQGGTTCALTTYGEVSCWGVLTVGLRPEVPREKCTDQRPCHPHPVPLPALVGVEEIAMLGSNYLCARQHDGRVLCGGFRNESWHPLAEEPALRGARRIAFAATNLCGVLPDGALLCRDHRGNGTFRKLPVEGGPVLDVFGGGMLCATTAGGLSCWPGPLERYDDRLVHVPDVPIPVALASGHESACALDREGKVRCFGQNLSAKLGRPTPCADGSSSCPQPARLVAVSNVIAIAVASRTACALDRAGTLQCWGQVRHTPPADVPVQGLAGVTQLCAGRAHACAVVADGTVRCWGDGELGALGSGTSTFSSAPVTIPGLTHISELTCDHDTTCARSSDGALRCWGFGNPQPATVPGFEAGVTGFTRDIHLCARHSAGTVDCELTGDAVGAVPGFADIVEIQRSNSQTCGRSRDGRVHCIGQRDLEILGITPARDRTSKVVEVKGLGTTTAISVGPWIVVGRRTDGSWWGWGHLHLEFPEDVSAPTSRVTALPSLTGAEQVVFTLDLGAIWRDAGGRVQQQSLVVKTRRLTSLEPAIAIAASSDFACSIRRDRTVMCTGANTRGQLGRGFAEESFEPVAPDSVFRRSR